MASRIKIRPWHMLGGAALYGSATYAVYSYLNAHKLPTSTSQPGESTSEPSNCAFDVIADKYDKAVGSEEWSMVGGAAEAPEWSLKVQARRKRKRKRKAPLPTHLPPGNGGRSPPA